jgi:hypothetical protein
MGGDFPAKPMAVYATIWDGSAWATDGGKYKVNYKHAPFASDFSGLAIVGSRADDPVPRVHGAAAHRDQDQEDLLGLVTADYYAAVMTPRERAAMRALNDVHGVLRRRAVRGRAVPRVRQLGRGEGVLLGLGRVQDRRREAPRPRPPPAGTQGRRRRPAPRDVLTCQAD